MTRRRRVTRALAAGAAWLAGCAVGPNYQRPEVEVPAGYHGPNAASGAAVDTEWWKLFGDPTLTALEEQARDANQALQLAIGRVDEARATARIARADFFPTLTLDPQYTVGRQSPNRPFAGVAKTGAYFQDVQVPFDLSYEIDFWGRVRRSFESSTAAAVATVHDYQFVSLTVAVSVATTYFAIRSLDAQAAILDESRGIFEEQVRVVDSRHRAGLVSDLDLAQAQTQLASTIAQQADVSRARAEAEHALAVLCGRAASDFSVPVQPLDLQPPVVPAGVPSELLQNRPDVASAEQSLVAANAEIGVAKALFFPQVRLTGAAGLESASFGDLVKWESRLWEIGPSVSAPIFEGGRLRANLSAAEARYAEQVASYRQSVLAAFQDVEDALIGIQLRDRQANALADAVESSGRAAAVSRAQYDRGIADYLQVVIAETSHLNLKLQAAQIDEQKLDAAVLLVRAIGGGWQ
ncbi:MAG TPA: efflux transporter outer membrane subunit [Myxococcota bacterium]|nr:efflux transporter outer membrane subunit [Myxococcota bacterium]